MAAPKKIQQRELIEKILDLDVPDEELSKYFVVDPQQNQAFAPQVVPNPNLVEQDNGLEGAFLLNTFNALARARRNRKYRRRIKNWNGIKIVAEGDSWFQYPLILKDTIDQLNDLDNFEYAIYGLSEAGDLLSNIVIEDEISTAIENENPDVFLISGGGNDMVGNERMATLVHPFNSNRKPENYPNERFTQFLDELESLYRGLFSRLLANKPHLKILCHGYDNAIPANGTWLGKPLEKQGITDKVLQRQIVATMISTFNQRLAALVTDFSGSVYHVDCQRLIGTKSKWHDELHPKNAGYLKVAQKFDQVIKLALEDQTPSAAIELESTANTADTTIKLAQVSKLDNQDFLNLVVKRAETVMNKDIPMPKNRYERKQLEQDISNFFEKIHKENNFLPSSFLENGVSRAQAVCRIVTDVSLGSGFLIASGDFIMTNNHVIPDITTAELSRAEFDYDEDDILYTVQLDPQRFFITDVDLDFTIIACDPAPLSDDIEPIALLRDPDTVTRGERVNIIQHPRGRRKEISLHDNKVNYVYDVGIRYTADTEGGSSGSPVFNNEWNLVALHHAGWQDNEGNATNEGIRINAIVAFLMEQNSTESSTVLAELLECVTDCETLNKLKNKKPKDLDVVSSTSGQLASAKPKGNSGKTLTVNVNNVVDEITINFD